MLKKNHRLSKEKDIKFTTKRGRNFFTPYFVVKFVSKKESAPRFAIIVSTKVSKKAVVRNRIKRVAREALRRQINKFVPGDYIIVMRQAAEKLNNQTLSSQLIGVFVNIKLLRE